MTKSSPQARHLVSAAMLFSVPTVSTLAILMALGSLEIAPGLTAMAASVALTVLFVRSLAADITRLDAYVRALPWGNPSVPYLDRPELTAELAYGLGHLRRNLRQDRTELAERLASAERVVDGIPDPLLLLDPQRRVVRDNRAARLLFGKEAANRDLAALLRVPALLEAVERAFVHGGPEEVEFVLPVPVERDLRARIEHLTIPGADGTVAVLTLQDISALKRIQKMRVDFVANASHELRTPLASLIGFIDTLRGPARDDAEARERFLNIMYDQATRMSRLVDDLLSLSRIELHEYTQPLNRVALAPLLERVAETLQLQVTRRGMTIDIDAAPGLPEVMGQPDELFQVFLNLFDNAVKYGREGSVVEVTACRMDSVPASGGRLREGAVAISIRDSGEGIAKEHLPRLTERFFRIDSARSRTIGGTGLGLAIVKHVVNRHRGLLTVDSVPGQGSVFTVHLPPAPMPTPAT